MADTFSFRRVIISIAATWIVSGCLGLIGVPDYQRGVLAGVTGVASLWLLRSMGCPRG